MSSDTDVVVVEVVELTMMVQDVKIAVSKSVIFSQLDPILFLLLN